MSNTKNNRNEAHGELLELITLLKKSIGTNTEMLNSMNNVEIQAHKSSVSSFFRSFVQNLIDSNHLLLDLNDINLKILPVSRNNKLKENLTYTRCQLNSITADSWDDLPLNNSFKALISKSHLIITYVRPNDFNKLSSVERNKKIMIKHVLHWKPSESELDIIGNDYNKIRHVLLNNVEQKEILGNKTIRIVDNIPKESQSKYVHIRPKAKNKDDIDKDYYLVYGKRLTKRAFYLNKSVINKLINDEG
jgi:hypothetical protein